MTRLEASRKMTFGTYRVGCAPQPCPLADVVPIRACVQGRLSHVLRMLLPSPREVL